MMLPIASIVKSERDFLYIVTVNRPEVVPHGNDMVSGFAPLLSQLKGFLAVGVVTGLVIGNEHEGRGLVLGVA